MALTPAEVRAVQFETTRMRTGYQMDEVDAFLDIIEADISQLTDDLQRSRDGEAVLRAQCDQLQQRLAAAERRLADVEAAAGQRADVEDATTVLQVVSDDVAAQLAGHPDAAAVLAVAQRTADEIIRFAQVRADGIRGSVRRMLDEQRSILDRD